MPKSQSLLPLYDFSVSLNTAYLKKLLPLLTQHQVAANPINYALFYDYVSGQNQELNKSIDTLLSQSRLFDCDTSMGLYETFICNASHESFENINNKIHQVLEQATHAIRETHSKAEQTNDSFQKKTAILETAPETEHTRAILQDIIKEIQSLAATSLAMQTRLTEANAEMEQLRTELSHVRQIAVTDGLTGLLNRRAFDQTLLETTANATEGSICLSLIDIDHFKRVNDSYGHPIGDNVIKYVASLLKKHSEEHHHVARYGGEEMAIIMPNTSKQKAIEIAEKIRADMESSRLKRKTDDQLLGKITLSAGVAEWKASDNIESFINRADTALYQAKESGRNRVMH